MLVWVLSPHFGIVIVLSCRFSRTPYLLVTLCELLHTASQSRPSPSIPRKLCQTKSLPLWALSVSLQSHSSSACGYNAATFRQGSFVSCDISTPLELQSTAKLRNMKSQEFHRLASRQPVSAPHQTQQSAAQGSAHGFVLEIAATTPEANADWKDCKAARLAARNFDIHLLDNDHVLEIFSQFITLRTSFNKALDDNKAARWSTQRAQAHSKALPGGNSKTSSCSRQLLSKVVCPGSLSCSAWTSRSLAPLPGLMQRKL